MLKRVLDFFHVKIFDHRNLLILFLKLADLSLFKPFKNERF